MLFKLAKDKKIYIAVPIVIILAVSGIYWFKFSKYGPSKKPREVPQAQKEQLQKDIVSSFKDQRGFNIAVVGKKDSGAKLKGDFTPAGDFQGQYVFSQPAQDKIPAFTKTTDIIRIGHDTYTKDSQDKTYQKDDKFYAFELNIMAHPEDIQIQEQLPDQTIDGVTYAQYSIIFEKPGQEIVKTMSQETLESLRVTGTILVRKDNFLLKQMKLHQGKENIGEFTIEYTINANPPKIEAPTNV